MDRVCGLYMQWLNDNSVQDGVALDRRLRRSLNRQQAPPGEYIRYKQRLHAGDLDSVRVSLDRKATRRQSAARLMKRDWENIAMSAWG